MIESILGILAAVLAIFKPKPADQKLRREIGEFLQKAGERLASRKYRSDAKPSDD